jgi:hypothetical protein
MQAKGRRGAYYRVVVTAALQANFVARILPALERAGSAWYRLPTFEDDGRSQNSNAIEAREMSFGNWCRKNHRWDVPMGEVLQTSPWERSPNDGKSSYTGRA